MGIKMKYMLTDALGSVTGVCDAAIAGLGVGGCPWFGYPFTISWDQNVSDSYGKCN